jgi:hypothetical protein
MPRLCDGDVDRSLCWRAAPLRIGSHALAPAARRTPELVVVRNMVAEGVVVVLRWDASGLSYSGPCSEIPGSSGPRLGVIRSAPPGSRTSCNYPIKTCVPVLLCSSAWGPGPGEPDPDPYHGPWFASLTSINA